METASKIDEKILAVLLKEQSEIHTATSLAKALNITRPGIWKTLKKLAEEKLINLKPVGNTKTSTEIITLNWDNPVTEKTLSLILTKEAVKYERWGSAFSELKKYIKFLIIFGSILATPKEANDIDILAVIDKKDFKVADKAVLKIQSTQIKKIHFIDLSEDEFIREFKKNKSYLDAIKKGKVLYGQDYFIKLIKKIKDNG